VRRTAPAQLTPIRNTVLFAQTVTLPFILKTAVKGDENGAGAQTPMRLWADAPFSTPHLLTLGL
jgi:hypothetical protein